MSKDRKHIFIGGLNPGMTAWRPQYHLLSGATSDIGQIVEHNPIVFTSATRPPLPELEGTCNLPESSLLLDTALPNGAFHATRPSSKGPWNPLNATVDSDSQRTAVGTSFMACSSHEVWPEDYLHYFPREITSIPSSSDCADDIDEADVEAIDKPPSGDPIGPPSPTMISGQNELNQVSRIKNNGGRQGKLDVKTAENAKEMRKLGACWNCKLNKYRVWCCILKHS